MRLHITLANGKEFTKEVHRWSEWGDGLIGFDEEDNIILKVNGPELAAVQVTELAMEDLRLYITRTE